MASQVLVRQVLPDDGVFVAADAPAYVRVDQFRMAMGTIMAAVSEEAKSRSSLGDPKEFP